MQIKQSGFKKVLSISQSVELLIICIGVVKVLQPVLLCQVILRPFRLPESCQLSDNSHYFLPLSYYLVKVK